MDLQTEQAVWRRVKAPGGVTAEEAILPERLEALILQERGDADALRQLSRRAGGREGPVLSRIAEQTERRTRELTALHYVLTGRRLRVQKPPARIPASMPEALREAYLRLEQSAKSYDSLSAEFEKRFETFSRFARQSRDQAKTLLNLLQNRLPRATGS